MGRLVLCQHGNRQVARLAADGHSFETVVAKVDGKRFSSPNDLCFDRAGNLFFTDPPYGLPSDTPQETAVNGVLISLGTDGKLTVLVERTARGPTGVALSPDEKTLYIGSTDDSQPYIKAYPLNADGTVSAGRVFYDGTEFSTRTKRHGGFDGLKVDALGNVWTSGPGGILVIGAGGQLLGSIVTNRPTANCAFGDPDHQTLYITANDTLLRVHTKVKGAGR